MTQWIFSLALCLTTAQALASEVLLTFETVDGGEAFLIGEHGAEFTTAYVNFGKLTVEKDGKSYRLSYRSANAVMDTLCEPFKDQYPYTYSTAETTKNGIFGIGAERVAELTQDGRIAINSDEIVVTNYGSCAKEMY